MEKGVIKVWLDPEADMIEVILEEGSGVDEDTENKHVTVRRDRDGRVLSFSIEGIRRIAGAPIEVELKPKKPQQTT